MGEYVVYILESVNEKLHYTGFTSDLVSRIQSHNGLSSKGFTKRYRPWVVIYVEFFELKSKAMQREKYFKSGAGRRWLEENLNQ